jgi:hypothetical protein
MAALSADKLRRTRALSTLDIVDLQGADSSTFYDGAIACVNTSGKIAVGADTASFVVAGIVRKQLVTGASNTALVQLERGHQEWIAQDGNITIAMIGKDASILDSGTLTNAATATNDIRVGRICELETINGVAGCWVAVGVHGLTAA